MDKFTDSMLPDTFNHILYKHANRSKAGLFSRMDIRILFLWHLLFAVVPWFIYSPVTLALLFIVVCMAAIVARTSAFLILIMAIGVFSNLLAAGMIAFYFGAGFKSVMADIVFMTIKLLIVSLASISVFTSVDAEKIRDGLLSLGVPSQICFAFSYGYRILPLMIEDYREIIVNYRIRSGISAKRARNRLLYRVHILKLYAVSFYPMILNTAKRTRTTVEALEAKGFGHHHTHRRSSKRLKLEYMKIRKLDVLFISGSVFLVVLSVLLGFIIPI